jgi:hypothetical protein
MRRDGRSPGNKHIATDPLRSGVIAIFVGPSTPHHSSTIIVAESK